MLSANLRTLDHARAVRLILAWLDSDKLALDAVLAEADEEAAGLPGLLFAVTEVACITSSGAIPNVAEHYRGLLLELAGGGGG